MRPPVSESKVAGCTLRRSTYPARHWTKGQAGHRIELAEVWKSRAMACRSGKTTSAVPMPPPAMISCFRAASHPAAAVRSMPSDIRGQRPEMKTRSPPSPIMTFRAMGGLYQTSLGRQKIVTDIGRLDTWPAASTSGRKGAAIVASQPRHKCLSLSNPGVSISSGLYERLPPSGLINNGKGGRASRAGLSRTETYRDASAQCSA